MHEYEVGGALDRDIVQDPLRNVSVRYKLALTFVGVCALAFGLGGYVVSRSAMDSLEREIRARLGYQCEGYATALEGNLRALGQRARDFASDGHIRAQFEALSAETDPGEIESLGVELRRHLLENKLTIVDAFQNLAIAGVPGGGVFVAETDDLEWTTKLPPEAFLDADWYSGLIPASDPGRPPIMVVTTPLWSLSGDRRIGNLLVRIHPAVWIASGMGGMRTGEERAGPAPKLRLSDSAGRTLEIPGAFTERPAPAISSFLVRDAFGLRLGDPARGRETQRHAGRGVFSRKLPIAINGWFLETEIESREALAAVSGLQARFLFVGAVLTAAACLFLFFPMRFLARPLRILQDAARQMREGNFATRVPVSSTDEIGELSHSFNLMAEAVEERTESLKQRKDELRNERDRLNAVILSMRDGLMVLDADGKPELWNKAAKPLMSIAEGGGAGLSAHRNCQSAVADDSPSNGHGTPGQSACHRCLFEPAAPPRSCLVDAGSSVFEVHSTPLASEPDRRSGRVLVVRDVTDRIAQDEHEIHRERLAVLGEVAAVVAHELNNPLAAIRMFTQMLASKITPDSELAEDVSVIERNTQSCSRTIRELLDYATGSTPEVGPIDVHATLEDVGRFLRALRERKETELELELTAEDSHVVGDEVQLRQVFVNLVMNALQAAGDGGGQVRVRTSLDSAHLVVDVEDDGPGIAPEVAEEIFKPFYTTKPRGSGTGLGLPTARRITEIQGGGLELVDGRPGHTTFRVRLLRGQP